MGYEEISAAEQIRMIRDYIEERKTSLKDQYGNNYVAFTTLNDQVRIIGSSKYFEETPSRNWMNRLVLTGKIDELLDNDKIVLEEAA